MFSLFFPPQAIVYTLLMGPLGVIGAWYSLILQASTLSIFVVTISLMPHIQRVAYDAILSRECANDVVLMGKLRRYRKLPIRVRAREYLKAIPDFSIFPFSLLKLLVFFGIYFIPFVGPIIVLFFQSSKRGLKAHARYFELKGFLRSDIRTIHKLNRPAYMGYGVVALWLELFPFINMFFMFTNTLGAALWAVDIEQQEKAVTENVAAATTTATDTNSVNQQGLVIPVHNEPATNIPEATPKTATNTI